jgi:pyridoxal phosphate enzyme (YggS family)
VLHGLGQRAFGENYVQEAVAKMEALAGLSEMEWHLIGPLQSNKTGTASERFDWVHGVDRLRIAERLSALRPPDLGPLNVCIQVNISGESTKRGSPEAPESGAGGRRPAAAQLRGLMGIAEPTPVMDRGGGNSNTPGAARIGRAAGCRWIRCRWDVGRPEAAVAEGATIVRMARRCWARTG